MGIILSVVSTICLAVAGILYSYCFLLKPNLNPLIIALVRIVLGFLPPLFFILKKRSVLKLIGKNRRDLIFWGLAGAATVTTFFFSSQLVGVGITQMLSSIQGLVFFFGAPILLNESPRWRNLTGLLLSILGLNFILSSRAATVALVGANSVTIGKSMLFGILSGFFGGIAYLFMVRCRKTDCSEVIAFYWAVPSLILQLALLYNGSFKSESNSNFYHQLGVPEIVWICAVCGGILTVISQLVLAEAYSYGNVVLITLITYLGPIINLSVDVFIGKILLSTNLLIGVFLIIFGSGIFPILNRETLFVIGKKFKRSF
jgi:drug/metabolite transporter (DMT)-like permease